MDFSELLTTFLSLLVGLFSVVNPLAAIPVWITLTEGESPEEQRPQIIKVAKNVFVLLLIFLLLGNFILSFFGITLTAIKLAGGFVIVISAINMLLSNNNNRRLSKDTVESATDKEDITFSPMSMPMLVGPGSMALVLSYSESFGYLWTQKESAIKYGLTILGIGIVCTSIFFILKYSKYIIKALGPSGIIGLSRMMAFILLSLGMQYLVNGVKDVVKQFME